MGIHLMNKKDKDRVQNIKELQRTARQIAAHLVFEELIDESIPLPRREIAMKLEEAVLDILASRMINTRLQKRERNYLDWVEGAI